MSGFDLYAQLAHVLSGRTADGHPGDWPPIPLNVSQEATLTLLMRVYFRHLSLTDPDLRQDDQLRTALLRVAALWVVAARLSPRLLLRLVMRLHDPVPPVH